jgi:hypothetical protein
MTHPFPYVGSGIAAARKAMECSVCFRAPVPKAERAELERGVPAPLAGFFRWSPNALTFGNDDDSLQRVVRAHYAHVPSIAPRTAPDSDDDGSDAGGGGDDDLDDDDDDLDDDEPDPDLPSEAQWAALSAELDAWLLGVHARHPVAAVVRPIDEEYSTATDAWHEWSCERIPTEVLPALEEQGKPYAAVAAYVADLWRTWAEGQSRDRQRELVAALPDAAREALARHDALFEPPPPPPPRAPRPAADESEQIWRAAAAAGGPLRLEDAYTAALLERGLDAEYSLTNHLHALEEAGRHADIIDLARAALASGTEFPAHWLRPAVDALVALGRDDEAGALMPALVGHLESYSPDMLVTAMRYHRATGEPTVEAMLYHAGVRWFTTFGYHVTHAEAEAYGAAPDDLPDQFAAWLARWVAATQWSAATQPRLGHWLVWFEAIGKRCFPDQIAAFEAERDRRAAARARLPVVTNEAAARALIEQLLPTADTEDAARAFHALRERAPAAAFDFLLGAIRNERREGYRFPRGERVDAVISLLWLALNVPTLRARLPEAYEIAAGYVLVRNAALHYNLGCAAARLDDRAAVLRHVDRALALGWDNPPKLHADADFAALRGAPDFEQLFAADAERRAAEVRATQRPDDPAPRPRPKPAQAKSAKSSAAKSAKSGAAKSTKSSAAKSAKSNSTQSAKSNSTQSAKSSSAGSAKSSSARSAKSSSTQSAKSNSTQSAKSSSAAKTKPTAKAGRALSATRAGSRAPTSKPKR